MIGQATTISAASAAPLDLSSLVGGGLALPANVPGEARVEVTPARLPFACGVIADRLNARLATMVGEDDRVRPVGVGILAWREDGALLRAELPAGARLVVAGVHALVEGETVRAVEEGAPVLLDVKR